MFKYKSKELIYFIMKTKHKNSRNLMRKQNSKKIEKVKVLLKLSLYPDL